MDKYRFMTQQLALQLVGIRDLGGLDADQVKMIPLQRTAQLVRCKHCDCRYWLLIEVPDSKEPLLMDDRNITAAFKTLAASVSAEHTFGHPSARLNVPYRIGPPEQQCTCCSLPPVV